MDDLTPTQRAEAYAKKYPKWPAPRADERWLDANWVMGQNYQGSGYYGSYPPNYVDRVMALFPDAKNILHLFSGSLPPGNYTRFDKRPEMSPDVVGDAHYLSEHFEPGQFDLVVADPPYSVEDAEHYGVPMVKRQVVIGEIARVLQVGGHLVWLDQVLPQFSKETWHWWGFIGMARSTMHRFRCVTIFKRVGEPYVRKKLKFSIKS